MQPPVNLQPDELLGAVVERLLKALRAARPQTVRQFFALANQHMRWELNDLARRLDSQPAAGELCEGIVPSPPSSVSKLTPNGLRMLQAIDDLPEEEREVFDLVRIQGMTQVEAAEVLGVSTKTVQRRLNRALLILSEALDDLRPGGESPREPWWRFGPAWRRRSASEAGYATAVGESRDGGRSTSASPARGDPRNRTRTPEEVCRACPELLPKVRDALEAPARARGSKSTRCSRRRDRQRHRLSRRIRRAAPDSRATTSRRCSGAAAWASSTRRGTCA